MGQSAVPGPDGARPVPDWAGPLLDPENSQFRQGRELIFKVESVDGLYGGRLRLIVSGLRPSASSGSSSFPDSDNIFEPMSQKAVWTLQKPDEVFSAGPPIPEHFYKAHLRLRLQEGFRNFNLSSPDDYWHGRGVYYRLLQGQEGLAALPVEFPETSRPPEVAASSYSDLLGLSSLRRHSHSLRQALLDNFATILAPETSEGRGIVFALLSGDRRYISQDTANLFSRSALVHSLALSGTHLGLASLLGAVLVFFAARLLPVAYLYLPRIKLVALCSLPFALGYLWLGGFAPSLLRAGLMMFFGAWLLLSGRLRRTEDVLILALCAICLMEPRLLFDLGLQLSVISVATIALCLPLNAPLSRLLVSETPTGETGRVLNKVWRAVLSIMLISFSIQIVLTPISLNYFGETPLFFILNLIWLPVLGVMVLPLAFFGFCLATLALVAAPHGVGGGLVVASYSVASALLELAAWPCTALIQLLQSLDSMKLLASPLALRPLWQAILGFWGFLFCFVSLWRSGLHRDNRKALGLALTLCYALMLYPVFLRHWPYQRPDVQLSLLDVGQGQSVYLNILGRRIVCDGGGFNSPTFDTGRGILAPVLTMNAPPRLDQIINTHPDNDHLGGLLYLLRSFSVEHFAYSLPPEDKDSNEKLEAALRYNRLSPEFWRQGREILLARGAEAQYYFEVLHPVESLSLKHPNDHSLVLRLVRQDSGGKRHGLLLILGDLQRAGINHLLRSGQDLSAEVLVLPHHGSAGSLSRDLYQRVNPRLALASTGRNNQWGFPAAGVRQALRELNIPLRYTADEGEIQLSW